MLGKITLKALHLLSDEVNLHRQYQRQYDEGNIHLGTRERDVKKTNYQT